MRNPPWTLDELIVTLHFYLTHSPSLPSKTSPEVSELSGFLNRLRVKLGGNLPDKFRNHNGVYMKLMNFRRFDPNYEGVGLTRGNKNEGVVWERYFSRPDELKKVTEAIRSVVLSGAILPPTESLSNDDEEGEEGQVLTRLHRYRERNSKLVKRKKGRILREQHSLVCEACGFDFKSFYGERGYGFIECHHTKPLSELSSQGERTKMSELALVCSNCHRMIHRGKAWLSIDDLRRLVKIPLSSLERADAATERRDQLNV